jgi:hypothetical protein
VGERRGDRRRPLSQPRHRPGPVARGGAGRAGGVPAAGARRPPPPRIPRPRA